jgi:erythromycin esterase-like protein
MPGQKDKPSSFKDLAPLKNAAADARIIALGEATHGTSEFFRMKHRVLEFAVMELGVRVFAIEDNQLVVRACQSICIRRTRHCAKQYGWYVQCLANT